MGMVKGILVSLGEGIGTQWHILGKIFFGIQLMSIRLRLLRQRGWAHTIHRRSVMKTSIDVIAFAVRWLL
jgi:hypothetical protein